MTDRPVSPPRVPRRDASRSHDRTRRNDTSLAEAYESAGDRRKVKVDGTVRHALEQARLRLMVSGVLFTIAFLVLIVRLADLAVITEPREPRLVANSALETEAGSRADIVDRNGLLMATSLNTASMYADPQLVLDPVEAASKLITVLPDLSYNDLVEKLTMERRFVWLKRNLTPRQMYEVNRLGLPGIAFRDEERRIYPAGPVASHVLGYANVDNVGLAGVEKELDGMIRGASEPVALSIDSRVQHLLHQELSAAVEEFQAIGAAGLVMDVKTGEMIAMVSLPDFDPHQPGRTSDDQRFNRTTHGVYEMGSTFKIFNTAIALDTGVARMSDIYDATNPIRVGRFTITDFHPERRPLNVAEIFKHSSNIGSVRMALEFGTEAQRNYLGRFGLLERARLELPETGSPMAPNPWREINTMTISYGHGMAVTPIQMARGVAAAINGGTLPTPTLLRRAENTVPSGERVIQPSTSDAMRKLMRLVVADGTGRRADAPGYLVGGKTGTAEKTGAGGYGRSGVMSSFIGAYPMNDPQYVVLAMIDEPKGNESTFGFATGGWVAAPVIGRVVERMAPMVGIHPFDETSPEIRNALSIDVDIEGDADPGQEAAANGLNGTGEDSTLASF